jgi:Polyketide cyclase / dehydrase and lipid transport
MIATLLILVAALLLVVLLLAARKPDVFVVQRSIRIAAPATQIFPHLDDFHRWKPWSPFENKDPAMQRTYSGAPSGKGAVYEWTGNSKVGSGRMEILQADAPSKTVIDLQFITPFRNHCVAEFSLSGNDDDTTVLWEMKGPAPFVSKLMQVFMNMDRMIGRDFETGLASLKAVVERRAEVRAGNRQ